MYRTYIYLPEELKREIDTAAKDKRKSKAAVIREALEKGIRTINPKRSNSAKALLEMVKRAEKLLKDEKLPKDLAKNHDKYTWG